MRIYFERSRSSIAGKRSGFDNARGSRYPDKTDSLFCLCVDDFYKTRSENILRNYVATICKV